MGMQSDHPTMQKSRKAAAASGGTWESVETVYDFCKSCRVHGRAVGDLGWSWPHRGRPCFFVDLQSDHPAMQKSRNAATASGGTLEAVGTVRGSYKSCELHGRGMYGLGWRWLY